MGLEAGNGLGEKCRTEVTEMVFRMDLLVYEVVFRKDILVQPVIWK